MRSFSRLTVLMSLLFLSACGGGGADTEIRSTNVSKGQELMDLKKAYESGVISQSEYEDQKEDILDRD